MTSLKYMVLVGVIIESICSVQAMEQQPADGQGPWSVQRIAIVRLIAEGQEKVGSEPHKALSLFQRAYDAVEKRNWHYDLKDGKLALVLSKNIYADQTDIYDVEVWKLLLDQVNVLRKQADGVCQERVALLCARTARKLARAYCGSLALAQSIDVAWQAETLESCLLKQSLAEELVDARTEAIAALENNAMGGGLRNPNSVMAVVEKCKSLEMHREGQMKNIVSLRERLLINFKRDAKNQKK